MKHTIKLVIFDCYGLILNEGYPNTSKELAKRFGGKWQDYHKIMYSKYLNQAAVRQITQKEAWVKSAKKLQLPISWQKLRDIHYRLMKVDKRVYAVNRALTKAGYTTLMLSKNTRSQLADTSKRFGFKKEFKNIINTWELNLPKASKKTLRMILKRFKVKPAEVIYADDQEANLVDAKEMGIKTIFVKNYKQFKRDLGSLLSQ